MKLISLRTAFCGLSLLAAPAALAWGSTHSIPQFESRIAAARASGSAGGTTVVRSEIQSALDAFLSADDGRTDAEEYAYLASRIASPVFLTGIDASAQDYLFRYHELNDAVAAPLTTDVSTPAQTPAQILGASGPLANNAWIQAGGVLEQGGVLNQTTLEWAYYSAFGPAPRTFSVVTLNELIVRLNSPVFGQTPSSAEVNGAVAYLSANAGEGARYYVTTWVDPYGRTGPGDIGGYVVASVNEDRDSVRFIEVMTWSQ
ncbi:MULTISPECIES: hypothetical protein [Myxococcus]|uniref:hypothetical protein n=1 Tax=Myxococcus TaxID=32 RepID=UPI0011422F24|nr:MULTISPECIES: hypothetical protein [Myxococcus]NOK06668.1 hypothetical protein [Myxococcus xanthus]